MSGGEGPAAAARAALIAKPLGVKCRKCGRKAVFGALSMEARTPGIEAAGRLVCGRCGSRDVRVQRLSDDREAARWLADR